jgi:ABC-type uncharacterized transport system substrate-binding protein
MSKIFELIRPKSLNDSSYEDYEYLIRWIGRDGSEYLYMFYDAELEIKISNEVVNEQDSTRLKSLITKIGQAITLQVDDLSKNDLQVIAQIFENQYVTRILKDSSEVRYAPDANSFKYRLMDGRYEVDFKLILADVKAWK